MDNIDTITSTEFQAQAGRYIDIAGKSPLVITKHSRPARVLMDYDEYSRLKAYDTRQALYPHELDAQMKDMLEEGYRGRETPDLDHLLEDDGKNA